MENKIIYSLSIEDVQLVANEILNRTVTNDEMNIIEETINKNVDWFEIIENVIITKIENQDNNK
ncbi:MAG: hypothetical protein QY331_15570 [Melioribacteraceae bacterium]|nr:MAG: hypothetical protein QY331_15570 [Melioribacteraceae bacterium]